MFIIYLQYLIFYFSYFVWLVLPFFVYWTWHNFSWFNLFVLIISLLFIYARFIEPQILLTKHLKIKVDKNLPGRKPLTIGVLADIHCGIFKKRQLLARAVKRLNNLNPDLIFLPGDFIYQCQLAKIRHYLSPLKELKAPVFAVSGNHDIGLGRNIKKAKAYLLDFLYAVLSELGVKVIDNKIVNLKIKGYNLVVFGLADFWAKLSDFSILTKLPPADFIFGLVHNPDVVYEAKFQKTAVDLTVCGHTHGGQIRIPWLYKKIIPTKHSFIAGLYSVNNNKTYISSGLGETGLPLRLFVPPCVDIIEIKAKE